MCVCVCVYSVVLAQCWRSGGRVRAVSAMFWQRIQSQVSCDCIVLTDLDRIWCLQIAVMSNLGTDPMEGILFARAGLNISGSEERSKFGGPVCAYF